MFCVAANAGGNVLTIAETTAAGTKTETRSYDTVGRLESVTDRNGKLRSYQYDAADNRVEEKDHTNQVVTHAFDARNRLASTVTPELGTTTYTYDGADRLAETSYANLSKEIRSYDAAGQLTQLKHERAAGTLHSEIYEYDANGNRTKLTQNDGTSNRITTYTFDSVDRVLSESNPEERLEDTLDAVGNRTQRLVKNGAGVLQKTITYTINARDQITQIQEKNASNVVTKTETFGFDADGSRISKSDGTSTTTYKYDRRGRQVQAGTTTFELNDADVRTAKVDGARTEYVMEGLKLVAEVQGTTTLANYRWGGQLIGESRGGTAKTILQDRFRSPLIVLDQNGLISDRVRYTAAGEVRQRTGSSPLAFGFGGYLTQNGTDELYAFARTYSPSTGRFNEVDPLDSFIAQMPMGPHRYVMGYGNPLVYTDPDGRESACFSTGVGCGLVPITPEIKQKQWVAMTGLMAVPAVLVAGPAVVEAYQGLQLATAVTATGDVIGGSQLAAAALTPAVEVAGAIVTDGVVAGATIATAAKLGDEVLQAEKAAAQVIVAESKVAPAVVVKQQPALTETLSSSSSAKANTLAAASTVNRITERTVFRTSGLDEQVGRITEMVPGLESAQAKALLQSAFNPNKPVEVVIGGSRVRSFFGEGSFRPDSDLDIGFAAKMKNHQIDAILDAFDSAGTLKSERGIRIFSGNNPPSGPIINPQEFFQRSGVRGPFPPEQAGQPFEPSGYISVHPDGTITIVPPGIN